MKTLKKIGLGFAGLVALLLVIALFVKKEYTIERQVTINRPVADVFNYVKNIKNQDYYSKWNMADPAKKTTSKGTDGTVGFVYGWNGNDEVGEGEQEITAITKNQKIETELRFKRPMESTAQAYMITKPAATSGTAVTWGMHGESAYPMNLMNFMLDGMLGDDMAESLASLKTNLEK